MSSRRVARTLSRQPRIGRFLLLSLLLHVLAVVAVHLSPLVQHDPPPPAPQRDPIRVSFVRPEPTAEPEKPEVFAETSSRAQSPDGPKADTAKAADTVLPKERQAPSTPSVPIPPTPPAPGAEVRPAEEQPVAERVPEPTPPPASPPSEPREEKVEPSSQQPAKPQRSRPEKPESKRTIKAPEPKPTPDGPPEPKRLAKLPPQERPEPKPAHPPAAKAPQEPAPRARSLPESVAQPDHSRPPLFGRIPLLSGDDLEKYAQVRSTDQRSGSGDTVSLDTKELKYLSYFAHLKRRIEGVWRYPQDAVDNGLQGQLHLKFVLARNGQVKSVELLRSSGFKILDKEAWDAVVNAGPFAPFPATITDEELHITARFSYLLDETARRTRVR
jgi:periplasmic protein TonB